MEDLCLYGSSDDECYSQVYNDDDNDNYDYEVESLDGYPEVEPENNEVIEKSPSCKVWQKSWAPSPPSPISCKIIVFWS